MEIKKINLLFEDELNLENVSKIIDNDKAFLYSLLKLAGCEDCPELIEIKFGKVNKENENDR